MARSSCLVRGSYRGVAGLLVLSSALGAQAGTVVSETKISETDGGFGCAGPPKVAQPTFRVGECSGRARTARRRAAPDPLVRTREEGLEVAREYLVEHSALGLPAAPTAPGLVFPA